ncbi:MAG: AbrB/MazE/SpoVT family DNA-binding domain-containing protein [Moorea sp. SIO2B7]|nr:AbrB/MazE/SpoVT family DNA-binding domain-containing protein [Moorena sp. SIO2B7]
MQLKIRKIENCLEATLPQEILDKLQVREGDLIYVTETPDGVELTAYDPEFEKVMQAADEISDRYHNALQELAQ